MALFLPPYRDDISDNDDLESGVIGGRRLGSELTLLEDQEDWKWVCDRSNCDCKEVDEDEAIGNFPNTDAEILQNTPDANEDVDFWAQILADSSLYDSSAVTDDYYYEDERLRKFIENSITQKPESDAPELKVIPTAASKHLLGDNLLDASKQGHCLKVDDLLRQGADPNFPDEKGFTPLYYATREGYETVARLLVENGADIDTVFLLYQQAWLIRAICDGEIEEVDFLLRQGADPDIRDRWNVTPLFWAAFYGLTPVVDLLIDLNIDVKAAIPDNRTPLFQASIRGFTYVTKLLIEKGADAQVQDCWGETALFWAGRLGHNDVVEADVVESLKMNEKRLNLRLFRKAMRRRAERKQKELEEHLKKMQQKEIQAHLMELIIQNRLDRFFPADNHFLEQLVKRAMNLHKINPSNMLDPKDLSLLALHQFVIYCGNVTLCTIFKSEPPFVILT
ncbi:hypothetical protein N7488_005086 [Penicillium malachiteum]|nr:hypothetical protein N7488_005086 [Penicillium malachiteum]